MIPKNVAEILKNHVVLEVEGIDRMYLNGYVPLIQTGGGAATFIRDQLQKPFASTAAVAPLSRQFVCRIEHFARFHGIDIVTFEKKQRKDNVMKDYLNKFNGSEGVLFIGKAQEKAWLFRTVKRKNPHAGRVYPWLARGTAMPNQCHKLRLKPAEFLDFSAYSAILGAARKPIFFFIERRKNVKKFFGKR